MNYFRVGFALFWLGLGIAWMFWGDEPGTGVGCFIMSYLISKED